MNLLSPIYKMKCVNPGSCCLLALLMIYFFLRAQEPDWHQMPVEEEQKPVHDLKQKQTGIKAFLLVAGMAPCPGQQWSASVWAIPVSHGPLTSSHHASLVA